MVGNGSKAKVPPSRGFVHSLDEALSARGKVPGVE